MEEVDNINTRSQVIYERQSADIFEQEIQSEIVTRLTFRLLLNALCDSVKYVVGNKSQSYFSSF